MFCCKFDQGLLRKTKVSLVFLFTAPSLMSPTFAFFWTAHKSFVKTFQLIFSPFSCTASILNLCAISLDRYVAVTRPVTYPSIMSTRRAKSLIAGLWVLSFVICFPPLIGWRKDDSVSLKREKVLQKPLKFCIEIFILRLSYSFLWN